MYVWATWLPCTPTFTTHEQHTVGIWFEGFVEHGDLLAGDDLDAVDYFPLDEPFPPLAFPTDELVLKELQQAIQT